MTGRANIGEDVILRPVFANCDTPRELYDDFLAEVVKTGDRLAGLTVGEEIVHNSGKSEGINQFVK